MVAMPESNACENNRNDRRPDNRTGKPSIVAAHRACGDLHCGDRENPGKPREKPCHVQKSNENKMSDGPREGASLGVDAH